MSNPLPAYIYGRECSANERVVPLGDVEAYAAAAIAAARDCRSCYHYELHYCTAPWTEDAPKCVDGSKYEPLPPVKLWRVAP